MWICKRAIAEKFCACIYEVRRLISKHNFDKWRIPVATLSALPAYSLALNGCHTGDDIEDVAGAHELQLTSLGYVIDRDNAYMIITVPARVE